MNRKKMMGVALAALAAAGANNEAKASGGMKKGYVQCEGVAMKWVNDCGANGHACGGKATKNFQKGEWLKMSVRDCDAVKSALKKPAIRKYLERIQRGTATAVKRGKKI